MIVDTHTSIWQSPEQLGVEALARLARPTLFANERVRLLPKADTATHLLAAEPVDRCFVLGFKSRYMQAEIPNRFLADYCAEHADRMIGFAGIDPAEDDCLEQLARIAGEPHLQGLVICPAAQDFHPCDTRAMRTYEQAMKCKLPVIFSSGPYLAARTRLEYARPILLDEIARAFPDLKMVISHLGYPWVDEALTLIRKHEHVLANLAGLLGQPWIAYDALLRACQLEITDKLLFGSDFPFAAAAESIEALYNINQFARGTNLPVIDRENLRQIVENDALGLLGIQAPSGRVLAAWPKNRRLSRGG